MAGDKTVRLENLIFLVSCGNTLIHSPLVLSSFPGPKSSRTIQSIAKTSFFPSLGRFCFQICLSNSFFFYIFFFLCSQFSIAALLLLSPFLRTTFTSFSSSNDFDTRIALVILSFIPLMYSFYYFICVLPIYYNSSASSQVLSYRHWCDPPRRTVFSFVCLSCLSLS